MGPRNINYFQPLALSTWTNWKPPNQPIDKKKNSSNLGKKLKISFLGLDDLLFSFFISFLIFLIFL